MELKIKFLDWSTGLFGAMLNKKTAEELGIKTVDRISIKTIQKKPKEVFNEAVEIVQQKLIDRDKKAKRIADMEGKSLPDWVGKDRLN